MVKFLETDRIIISSYKNIARGIASFLGTHCEVVIHSLESLENSIIHIENGHISGRKAGAPITNYALELLSPKLEGRGFNKSYDTTLPNGKKVKSVTIPIDSGNRIIGMLCINLDIEVPFMNFISPFLPETNNFTGREYFGVSLDDMMHNLMDSTVTAMISNPDIPNQEKNKQIVLDLNEVGFFQLKGSTEILAERLQISIHTIYAHLRKNSVK